MSNQRETLAALREEFTVGEIVRGECEPLTGAVVTQEDTLLQQKQARAARQFSEFDPEYVVRIAAMQTEAAQAKGRVEIPFGQTAKDVMGLRQ